MVHLHTVLINTTVTITPKDKALCFILTRVIVVCLRIGLKVDVSILVEEVMTSFCLILEKCITNFNFQVNLISNRYQQQEKLKSFLNKMNYWKNDREQQKIDLVKQFILKSSSSARFLIMYLLAFLSP